MEAFAGKRWITLDPTPAAGREQSVLQAKAGLFEMLGYTMSRMWSQNILGMNISEQRSSLYDPLRRMLVEIGKPVTDRKESFTGFVTWLTGVLFSPSKWFSWQGGLAALILLSTIAATISAARRVRSLWNKLRHRDRRFNLT